MVGKLDLDMGDDYAFDIRRAKAVAENVPGGTGGGVSSVDPITPGNSRGPFLSAYGDPYWFEVLPGDWWRVGWNIDGDAGPDVWTPLSSFLDDDVNLTYRNDVKSEAMKNGYAPEGATWA